MPRRHDDPRRRDREEGFSRRYSPLRDLNDDKFGKFTERARKVLRLAQDEAQRMRHNYIGTEHLLLGLVREREGVAGVVLTRLGVDLEGVRQSVEQTVGQGDRDVTGEVGMTPRAKKVMELAVDEARRFNHHYIGTEHLLLGLLREGEGIAAGVLESLGLRLEQVRMAILKELHERGAPPEVASEAVAAESQSLGPTPAGPKNNVVTCRLDDNALAALDALVEAGIRSTRSDAAAWLIAAGIEAHRPLFERVQATIEEIRRLRAEAQQIARQVTQESAHGVSTPSAEAGPHISTDREHPTSDADSGKYDDGTSGPTSPEA